MKGKEEKEKQPLESSKWPWITILVRIHLPYLFADFPLPLLFIFRKIKKVFNV